MRRVGVRRLPMNGVDLWLFSIGILINLFAYRSFESILLAFGLYLTVLGLLLWPKPGGFYDCRIFTRVFAVGFTMAGVAAVYANYWADPGQLTSDANSFFEMATRRAAGLTLDDLKVIHEGGLAIVIWRAFYDFFAFLGFPRERHVGILLNVILVALTSVITLKMASRVYGQDPYRFKRLTLIFASCGLVWLFASIHIRDAIILLAVTALAYAWLAFLAKPGLGIRLVMIVGASILASGFFGFLRAEFVFVPTAMAMGGVAALMFGGETRRNQWVSYSLLMIGLGAATVLLLTFGDSIRLALSAGRAGYLQLAVDQHDSDSLGMALIVNQPMPIRLTLGSIYLFVFPIPFWSGFQLESVYHLFKSFNVLFFYFLTPLLLLSVRQLWKNKSQRASAFLFILFLSVGFTLSIAGTSLENRHLGAFLAPMFVLALKPDLRLLSVRNNYVQLIILMLGVVAGVHMLWVLLKIA